MEGARMDHICTTGVNNRPSVADDQPLKKISRDMSSTAGSGCFDCNICLEFAADPVVTLCGHLYCWPCIYEWLRPAVEAAASDNGTSSRRQCPVCKATLSPDTLVPLYGRGGSSKKPQHSLAIPSRPTVHRKTIEHHNVESSDNNGRHQLNMEHNPQLQPLQRMHHQANATEFDFMYPSSPVGRGMFHSTVGGVLGGMAVAVLPWAFRGQVAPSMYYSSPYHIATHNVGPRLRRQQMEVERSLHQIWFFLFVFVVLCLLLF